MPDNSVLRRLTTETVFAPSGVSTARGPDDRQPLLRLDQYQGYYGSDGRTTRIEEQQWQFRVADTLARYSAMQQGWDSYSGQPLRSDVGTFAFAVLSTIMRPRTPMPRLVPTSEGALQLEWHEKQIDLEVYISAPYACEVFFHDHLSGAEFSEELSNDFSSLAGPVAELTTR